MTASEGSAASIPNSTVWLVIFKAVMRAVVCLEMLMNGFASGGRKTIVAGSKLVCARAQSALGSAKRTGLCPAVTSGRKFLRGCQLRRFVGVVYCETPRKFSNPDHWPLVTLY